MLSPHLFQFGDEKNVGVRGFDFDLQPALIAHWLFPQSYSYYIQSRYSIMLKSIKTILAPSFTRLINSYTYPSFCSVSSTHRLPYGQGGNCSLNLLHNNYNIQFQTIWEDYCLIEISGESSERRLRIVEEGNQATIRDDHLQLGQNLISIKYKIPEDYTFCGEVNGDIRHVKSQVSNKLRCNQMNIKLVGKNRVFQWGSMECPKPNIQVENGAIDINGLTFENGQFKCDSFASRKVLFSGNFNLHASHLAHIRSVVTYGTAVARIKAKFVQIESISGTFDIDSEKVKIDRLWASSQGIKIKGNKIQKIGIETGTGVIESTEQISESAVTLGRLHKGRIVKVSSTKLLIQ